MNQLAWRRWVPICLASLLSALVLVVGCSGPGDGGPIKAGTGASGTGADGAGGKGGELFGSGGGMIGGLSVEPPEATIVWDNGIPMPANVDFEVLKDGKPVVGASWQVDFGAIATVDSNGLTVPTGQKGGEVKVTAKYEGMSGTAKLTVNLKKTTNPANVGPTEQDLLKNAASADPTTVWTYPYDKTVFPKGLLPPEMMWNNGGAGDLYRIHLKGVYTDYEFFTTADPPSRFSIDEASWYELTESGKGGGLAVKVTRLPPGASSATIVVDHDWTIAKGSLRGTVYYWANSIGRVVRIKPGSPAPDDFLAAAGVNGCSTCHTVSANGKTLAIGGDVDTSTFDLIANGPAFSTTSVGKPVRNWAMPAVSPNGQFLVENNAPLPGPPGGSDGVWDAYTGTKIPGKGLDGVFLDMPAFGPSGKHLAYVDHNTLDLGVYQYDSANNMFSNPAIMIPKGVDPNLDTICFPSVSPTIVTGEVGEKTWIVYHRGNAQSLDTRFGPGDLYLASADTPGVEIRLEESNGDNYPFAAGDRDRHYNYEPTFAPVNAGGYSWVVFTSRRTYGNRLTGGKDNVKQLWVTAIDQFPQPGQDPSHPAFWVPGQDLGTLNMRGFWALDPCIQQGDMCTDSAQCCDGEPCENGLCGGPKECVEDGGLCETKEDCCDPSAECLGGECGTPPPQ